MPLCLSLSVSVSIHLSLSLSLSLFLSLAFWLPVGLYTRPPVTYLTAKGNIETGFAESEVVIEGELRMGGQDHFYMETQACVCVPNGEGEMDVISSTQAVSKTQMTVAAVLGLPAHKVVCRVKRMGGGFGGKETRYATCLG